MTKKCSRVISLFMSMFLILGLGMMSHGVYAANHMVHIAVIGDSSASKRALLACLEKVAKSRSMPTGKEGENLAIYNVSDPLGRAPGVFDMEFLVIPGETWAEQLNKTSVHGERLIKDIYHCVLIAFDPGAYGSDVSPDALTESLDKNVVTVIKDKAFAPRPQLCFVPLRDNLAGDPGGLCNAVAEFALERERKYGDPYGYQDFYSTPVLTSNEKQVCSLISALCDCEAGRLALQRSASCDVDTSKKQARAAVKRDRGESQKTAPKNGEACRAAACDIKRLLVERGLYDRANIPVIVKVLRELAECDGLVESKWGGLSYDTVWDK